MLIPSIQLVPSNEESAKSDAALFAIVGHVLLSLAPPPSSSLSSLSSPSPPPTAGPSALAAWKDRAVPFLRSIRSKVPSFSVQLPHDFFPPASARSGDTKEVDDLVVALLDAGAEQVVVPQSVATQEYLAACSIPLERLVVSVAVSSSADVDLLLTRSTHPSAYLLAFGSTADISEALLRSLAAAKATKWLVESSTAPSVDHIRLLDAHGAHAVVRSSFLSTAETAEPAGPAGKLALGDAFSSVLVSDRADGLFPTMVVDEQGAALGLVYSSKESIRAAIAQRRGVYQSRKHGLWVKGLTSGATQDLLSVAVDCDRDALRFVVHQNGRGFCHFDTRSCFGEASSHSSQLFDSGLPGLVRTLESRKQKAPPGSYTQRLFSDQSLLHAKILEEASELTRATTPDHIAAEAADVLYFALVKCVAAGVSLADVEAVLDARAKKVTRRPGNAKPEFASKIAASEGQTAASAPASTPAQPSSTQILKPYSLQSLSPSELDAICKRPAQQDPSAILEKVKPIVGDVRTRGDAALVELTAKFDKVTLAAPVIDLIHNPPPINLPENVRKAIDLAFDNIYRFHEAQLSTEPLVVETCPGVVCSRFVRPIERVGLYIPGGSAVLPSTALMLGIPAKVAGCREIIFATPPRPDGSIVPEVLYVAQKVGASKLLVAGGAQAVAAMAYGTQSVPKVDKICGPGNQFVTAAKMLVQNDNTAMVSIDMPAGPSEVLVVCDATADPVFIASDLLSQAEHGTDSQVVLVAVGLSSTQLAAIQDEVERQVSVLPRQAIARGALSKSFVITVDTMEEALRFSNMYAPEHLIVNAANPEACLPSVQNAGSVFLGAYSPESCGDYASGTNHTLPTYGYARMYSGVSTSTFLKHITSQNLSIKGLMQIGDAVATLASVEGLDAHKNAVVVRQEKIKRENLAF